MKIISLCGGFSKDEIASWKTVVYLNIITQMKVICNAASKLGIDFESDEAKAASQRIIDLAPEGEAWSSDVGNDIKTLWEDPGIQKTYEFRDKKYQLNDSAAYFFDDIDRFNNDNYTPTHQDILRARIRSLGIEEAFFNLDGMEFKMVDVGGQRSERRKWIHCFDCVTAVMFCASLSEYDQTLREDPTQNRMKESLLLFDEICNSPWFADTAFILFLNKTDLLKDKISKTDDLKVTFPTYSGGTNYEAAMNFIKDRYMEMNTSPHTIYSHFTCAVDTEGVIFVFKCVRETLLKDVLEIMF